MNPGATRCTSVPTRREQWAVAGVAGGQADTTVVAKRTRTGLRERRQDAHQRGSVARRDVHARGTGVVVQHQRLCVEPISLSYDVSPDGQRFLFLREPATPAMERSTELVQITNWGAEVQAKLAGTR